MVTVLVPSLASNVTVPEVVPVAASAVPTVTAWLGRYSASVACAVVTETSAV